MSKQLKQEPFDGRAGEMRDSPWLASEDLEGLESIDLIVKDVFRTKDVEFEGGRSKEEVFSLQFSNAKRQLVLNGTNRKMMIKLFGADVKNWKGQTVNVYVAHNIKVGRDVKNGLRLRASAKQSQANAKAKSNAAIKSAE